MSINMQDVISDLCDGDYQARVSALFGGNHFSESVTPFKLLEWYADDMTEQMREAHGELSRVDAIDLRIFLPQALDLTIGGAERTILAAGPYHSAATGGHHERTSSSH